MSKVLVTGSEGFIGGYIVKQLLDENYEVIGIDNFSKYGKVEREHIGNNNFQLFEGDVKNS